MVFDPGLGEDADPVVAASRPFTAIVVGAPALLPSATVTGPGSIGTVGIRARKGTTGVLTAAAHVVTRGGAAVDGTPVTVLDHDAVHHRDRPGHRLGCAPHRRPLRDPDGDLGVGGAGVHRTGSAPLATRME
ncbi:hypothetical protein GCM10023148_28770 [Actinokineospora soli]